MGKNRAAWRRDSQRVKTKQRLAAVDVIRLQAREPKRARKLRRAA